MALSARDRVLYARHLLLAEVGGAGQERLCATCVDVPGEPDAEAQAVALDYLRRAGVKVRSDLPTVQGAPDANTQTVDLSIANSSLVGALAGAPELRHAASALLGAFAATEAIKAAIGIGKPATFPAELRFLSEDA